DVRVEQNIRDKVDILFLVDDSPSMSPKQQELRNRFPQLISIIDQFAAAGNKAWYHIGVVTSDLGANSYFIPGACYPQPDPPGLPNSPQHNRGAKLIAKGKAADPSCQPPTGGVNFIDYNQITGTNNLPTGQTLAQTFTCMASVGDTGCGLEHQLEAVYRA